MVQRIADINSVPPRYTWRIKAKTYQHPTSRFLGMCSNWIVGNKWLIAVAHRLVLRHAPRNRLRLLVAIICHECIHLYEVTAMGHDCQSPEHHCPDFADLIGRLATLLELPVDLFGWVDDRNPWV